tara:strand:- start:9276 stop:11258 length:1983 start_codon:yes stop_codon:yes gene_type:complete
MATREEALALLAQREAEGDLERANKIRSLLNMPPIDDKGAPLSQRAAIGASRGPGAKFQAAQGFDPGASKFGDDNFLINNTLYNPPGFDSGDIVEYGRVPAEALGSLTGGVIGMAGGVPTGPGAIATTMAGAGLGGEIAGNVYDQFMGQFGAVDTRGFTEQAKDASLSVAFNSMGAPQFRNPSHYIQGTASRLNDPARLAKQEVAQRGGWLTAGQTGNNTSARLEAGLESDPFGGNVVSGQRDQTNRIFSDIVEDATPGATSPEVAGGGVVEGMQRSIDETTAGVENAYLDFDRILEAGGGDRLNTISMEALQRLSAKYKEVRNRDLGFGEMVWDDPDVARAVAAIDEMVENQAKNIAEPGSALVEKPTYEVVKQLRTIIGKKINDAFYQGGEKSALKDLYKTLTDDLDAGAVEIGGEAAANARTTADALNTQLKEGLKNIDPVFKHSDNPSDVYKKIGVALVGNPSLARKARTAMGEEQWARFVDTWIRQAAQTKPGVNIIGGEISSNSTLTALGRLKTQSPEGYEILTQGRERSIAVIEELASMMRQGDSYMNRSRTANAMGTQQIASEVISGGTGAALAFGTGQVTPIAGALVGTLMRAAIPKLMSRVLVSKTLAKALLAVKAKHGENLPIGADLARALVASGASNEEVKDIFHEPK